MTSHAVQVEILGRVIKVNCPTGQEDALQQAANDLDNRINQLSERTKVTNMEQLLIIASLNISYELNEAKENASTFSSSISERIQLLSNALETAITKSGKTEDN